MPIKLKGFARRKHSNSNAAADDANRNPSSSSSGSASHSHTESSFRVLPRPTAAHTFGVEYAPGTPKSAHAVGQDGFHGPGYLKRPLTASNTYEDNLFSGFESRYVAAPKSKPQNDRRREEDQQASTHPSKHRINIRFRHRNPRASSATSTSNLPPHCAPFHSPALKANAPASTSSSGTNHSAGAASYDSSSVKTGSYSTIPSSQDLPLEPPPAISESNSFFRAAGRAFSFGSKTPKPPAFAASSPKSSTRERSGTASSAYAPSPKLPDTLVAGYNNNGNQDGQGFNLHMFDTININTESGAQAHSPPSAGHGHAGQAAAAAAPTSENAAASPSLKPPEPERSRRSSIFSAFRGGKKDKDKNNNSNNSNNHNNNSGESGSVPQTPVPTAAQTETTQPMPSPHVTPSSTTSASEPLLSGNPGIGKTSYGHSSHDSLAPPSPLFSNRLSTPSPPTIGDRNKAAAGAASPRKSWAGSGSNPINRHSGLIHSMRAEDESDDGGKHSDSGGEDDEPLFPRGAKSPIAAAIA
ncbi:hypothetical protein KEM55_002094, partial [Ascosphaera atra]